MSKEDKNKKLYELIEEIGEIIIDSVKRQVIKAIDALEIDIEIDEDDEEDEE